MWLFTFQTLTLASTDPLLQVIVDARIHVLTGALDTVLNIVSAEIGHINIHQVFIDEDRTREFLNLARELGNNQENVDRQFNNFRKVMTKEHDTWIATCNVELMRIKNEGVERIANQAVVLKQFNLKYKLDYEDKDIVYHYEQMDLIAKKTMGKILRYLMRGARAIVAPLAAFNEVYEHISHICSPFSKICRSGTNLLASECSASINEYYIHEIATLLIVSFLSTSRLLKRQVPGMDHHFNSARQKAIVAIRLAANNYCSGEEDEISKRTPRIEILRIYYSKFRDAAEDIISNIMIDFTAVSTIYFITKFRVSEQKKRD